MYTYLRGSPISNPMLLPISFARLMNLLISRSIMFGNTMYQRFNIAHGLKRRKPRPHSRSQPPFATLHAMRQNTTSYTKELCFFNSKRKIHEKQDYILMSTILAKHQLFRLQTMAIDLHQFSIQIQIPFFQHFDTGRGLLNALIVGEKSFHSSARHHLRVWLHRIFETIKCINHPHRMNIWK